MLIVCLRKFSGQSLCVLAIVALSSNLNFADDVAGRLADGQPLAANVRRLLQALDSLGAPLEASGRDDISKAISAEDGVALQTLLDPVVLFVIEINPELRVKVKRGHGDPVLQQGGYTPIMIKVINDATLARTLNISSPQAGAVYGGTAEAILLRQAQTELKRNENTNRERRFLDASVAPLPAVLVETAVHVARLVVRSNV